MNVGFKEILQVQECDTSIEALSNTSVRRTGAPAWLEKRRNIETFYKYIDQRH